jgi:hypothetical protein
VHCYCENRNRCARCNARLFERRLNANYYDPADRRIWHVPGFCGLARGAEAARTREVIAAQATARRGSSAFRQLAKPHENLSAGCENDDGTER